MAIRLMFDLAMLSHSSPTSLALAINAEEEFAKGFLLCLVGRDVLPCSKAIRRVTRDHKCKHLLSMIMNYCQPEFEEMMTRHKKCIERYAQMRKLHDESMSIYAKMEDEGNNLKVIGVAKWNERREKLYERIEELRIEYARARQLQEEEDQAPPTILDAAFIIRNEKIRLWEHGYCYGDKYDRIAQKIADGERDRQKQDALYVDVDPTGKVLSHPNRIDEKIVAIAAERVERLRGFLHSLIGDNVRGLEFENIVKVLELLFAQTNDLPTEELRT